MNILLKLLNPIQVLLILCLTMFNALAGILIVLLTWNRNLAIYTCSRILWSPWVLLISGVRLKVQGRENVLKNRACIYVANHASLFDIVVLVRAIPVALFFIAKMELRSVPFLGWYMRAVGMVFVDRSNREQAIKSMKKAALQIKSGKNVISFPEGTRSKSGELKLFKRGSFVIAREGNIDIVPVGIKGAAQIIPNGTFALRPGTVHLNIGKPISMADHLNKTDEDLAEFVREKVKELIS